MLQQTQVKTVIPYFERFIAAFPSIAHLAAASLDQVLSHWAGLGYYARARNLHKTAKILVAEYKGKFPRDLETLQKLPGLGRSTASAILAICFSQALPILDGNVKRVLTRYLGIAGYPGDKPVEQQLWLQAKALMPASNIPAYTQAIMDLGALICTSRNPSCLLCPVQPHCIAYRDNLINSLPTRKPKVAYPTKQAFFLILTDGHTILLKQRPNNGIWGGLWCLPEFKTLSDIPYQNYQILPERSHLFTHYRLRFTPIVIKTTIPQPFDWQALPNYGLPAPIKRLLDDLESGLIA